MKIVNFEQGSDDWLAWRKKLLTATDAPILLGVSPYCTPFKGWQRKLGLAEEQKSTPAMMRGHQDEPIARAEFIRQSGINFTPVCIESEKYSFLGASLDGLSDCKKYLLEIKSNGDQYHFGLNNGLPEFHLLQMQHQLLCGDGEIEMGFYLSWNKGQMIVKEIKPDQEWMMGYIIEAKKFWEKVLFNEPPEMTNKDYKDMNAEPVWESYACEYRRVCNQIKNLEILKDSYRKELIKLCDGDSAMGSGVKVMKKFVKGRVDYESIPELKLIDLESYRKPSSESWTILLDGK